MKRNVGTTNLYNSHVASEGDLQLHLNMDFRVMF